MDQDRSRHNPERDSIKKSLVSRFSTLRSIETKTNMSLDLEEQENQYSTSVGLGTESGLLRVFEVEGSCTTSLGDGDGSCEIELQNH